MPLTVDVDWQNRDSIWDAHPSNHRLVPGGSEYESRYLWVRNQIAPGDRVLDVGCNCGQLAVNLTEDLDCIVIGVDIVADFIEHCRLHKAEYGTFYHADFSRMGPTLFDRHRLWGSFDVVTALELIEHPIDVRGFRDNVCRALKLGGRLIITTPHPRSKGYGYGYLKTHAHHVRMWSKLRLEMVFGPCVLYHEIGSGETPDQIGAVFTL